MNRVLLLILVCASAFGQEPSLSLTWVGQACFILRTDTATVVTDPPAASVGYTIPAVSANAVTISHNHSDHNNAAGVGGNFTLIDGRPITARQETTAAGIPFVLIPGFHDSTGGTTRGQNAIIQWTQAGLKIAHMGDLGQDQLTPAQLADLRDLDILLIPGGGFFTFTPGRAAQYVAELKPRIAIPMHYKTALGGPAQLAALPAVTDIFAPGLPVVYKPSAITLSRSALPVSTEVWIMEPRSDAAVVNAASFAGGKPVAPGSLASIFGVFNGADTGQAAGYPLPRKIGNTEVFVDGKSVPLFYVSPTQANLQIPSAASAGQYVAEVRVGGQAVGRTSVTVVPNSPGLFVAANADGTINSVSNPARRGEFLTLYGTGQGPVNTPVEDGVAAGVALSRSTVEPLVFLAGKQVPIQFSGLAPGFAGLWQINVPLTADVPAGSSMDLTVVHGQTSNRLAVTIR